ncbi:hypothetical protein C8Q76DRAFT_792191 [Earliella scabrosa]|nr:hypothetical protein C8Q76DRAFT_792191 [Earliella scabrosa]
MPSDIPHANSSSVDTSTPFPGQSAASQARPIHADIVPGQVDMSDEPADPHSTGDPALQSQPAMPRIDLPRATYQFERNPPASSVTSAATNSPPLSSSPQSIPRSLGRLSDILQRDPAVPNLYASRLNSGLPYHGVWPNSTPPPQHSHRFTVVLYDTPIHLDNRSMLPTYQALRHTDQTDDHRAVDDNTEQDLSENLDRDSQL